MIRKPVEFLGTSLADLRAFPAEARSEAGFQLDRVQHGLELADWKPMTTVGPGVREIRIRADDGAFRVIYVAKLQDAIYVLHCFQKKTQKMSPADLDIAKRRYQGSRAMSRKASVAPRQRFASVWDAIEDTPAQAENMRLRSDLMIAIATYIERSGLTQEAAARQFGVTQPRISDLVRGKIALFSLDTLVNMIAAAGMHVRLEVDALEAA